MAFLTIFQRHLQLRVIALIVAILVLGFGVLVILNIQRETEAMVAGNRETARLLAVSITKSIENGMLEGRPDIIRRLVQELKKELKDVRVLDVYRSNGVEAFSDLETLKEVNIDAALAERISKMRRAPGKKISDPLFDRAVETLTPQETYEATNDGRMLTLFRPLENGQECQDCHSGDHKARGVVRSEPRSGAARCRSAGGKEPPASGRALDDPRSDRLLGDFFGPRGAAAHRPDRGRRAPHRRRGL